jgi:hypothetical protein
MSGRAERRRVEREARRSIGSVDRAAHTLMAATDEAVRQQRRLEANGLDPRDVHGPVLREDGEPFAERRPGTDAAGRVIVVTRKAALGPAVWYYTSREAGLDAMTRPAVAAFNAAKSRATNLAAHVARHVLSRHGARRRASARRGGARRYTRRRPGMTKKPRPAGPLGLSSNPRIKTRPKTRTRSKALANVSHSALRRASPAENVRLGFSPKARRYVKAARK